MSPIQAQRILAVSLLSTERVKLRCVYDGMVLVVAKVERIEGNFFTWKSNLIEDVTKAQGDGWSVLVEEMGDTISQHATPVLFSDPHPQENRPMLAVALDWYFAMYHAGTLQFQPGTEMCRITESAVDVSIDDRGRSKYSLDWQRVKGPQRAMMLACLAAEGFQPLSERFIEAMFGAIETNQPRINPVEGFHRALVAHDTAREREAQVSAGLIEGGKNGGQ